jgi:hypothetical protein
MESPQQRESRISFIKKFSEIKKEDIELYLKEVNDARTSEERVKEIVNKFVEYFPVLEISVGQHHFYRSRFWGNRTDYPSDLCQLLEPLPRDTKKNRCNIEKHPVLYVSVHPRALIAECGYKSGNIYVLTQFDRTLEPEDKDLRCVVLGIDVFQRFENAQTQKMDALLKELMGNNYEMYQFIQSKIHTQFVRKSDEKGLTYRFTANLCHRFFSVDPELDAIVYPSIENAGAVYNLAIRPNMYSKAYTASKVILFEVLEDGSSRQLASSLIDDNQNLNWQNKTTIDNPIPVNLRRINPNDSRIYIAPWRENVNKKT